MTKTAKTLLVTVILSISLGCGNTSEEPFGHCAGKCEDGSSTISNLWVRDGYLYPETRYHERLHFQMVEGLVGRELGAGEMAEALKTRPGAFPTQLSEVMPYVKVELPRHDQLVFLQTEIPASSWSRMAPAVLTKKLNNALAPFGELTVYVVARNFENSLVEPEPADIAPRDGLQALAYALISADQSMTFVSLDGRTIN